jgi:Ni/Co efflux regulator RcnB
MRKLLITLLLAGVAATPAVAGPQDRADRQQAQAERKQAQAERKQAREDSQPARAAPPARQVPNYAPRAQRQAPAVNYAPAARANVDAMRAQRDAAAQMRVQQQQQVRDQRVDQRQVRQDALQERIDQRRDVRTASGPPVVSRVPRPGTQPPVRVESGYTQHPQWNTSWRQDHRYDWRNYRNRHRSHFHLGFYYDPFGWGYQTFSIGWRLWPNYYQQNYWIDPGMYGLPYPPPGMQWVRYYNDALLVDTWSGQVVDVINGFFW